MRELLVGSVGVSRLASPLSTSRLQCWRHIDATTHELSRRWAFISGIIVVAGVVLALVPNELVRASSSGVTTQFNGDINAVSCGTPASRFYLSFPLPDRTSRTAYINSVLDHSLTTGHYMADNVVVAFTGEVAFKDQTDPLSFKIVPGWEARALAGFNNGILFTINGQYDGGGDFRYLYYDGHTGYDFKTVDQGNGGRIPVFATADGALLCSTPGTTNLDHGNGYTTQYLHMSGRICFLGGPPIMVRRGQQIGVSDGLDESGSLRWSPHLHLGLLMGGITADPYGWHGQYSDPLSSTVRNTNLFRQKMSAACGTRRHPDGSLITDGSTVWLIAGGEKRGITSESVFWQYGFDFADVIDVPQEEVQCIRNGPILQAPPVPRLINADGTVHLPMRRCSKVKDFALGTFVSGRPAAFLMIQTYLSTDHRLGMELSFA
jgi:murein DD-endopeptidase MepM/ murein hydrolase activator NlpD